MSEKVTLVCREDGKEYRWAASMGERFSIHYYVYGMAVRFESEAAS